MPKPIFEIAPTLSETLLTLTNIYEGLSDQEISSIREAIGAVINLVKQSAENKFPFIYDDLIAEFASLQQYLKPQPSLPNGIRHAIIFPQYYPLFFDNKYMAILQNLLEDLEWLDGEKPFFASHRGSENRREVLLLFKEVAIERKLEIDATFYASLNDIEKKVQEMMSGDNKSTELTAISKQIEKLKERFQEYTSGLQIAELLRIRDSITSYANLSQVHSKSKLVDKTLILIDKTVLQNRIVQLGLNLS